MLDFKDVRVCNLLFDEDNPRLANSSQDQREILRALAENQGAKLRFLAEDIVANGLNPSELMVVIEVDSPKKQIRCFGWQSTTGGSTSVGKSRSSHGSRKRSSVQCVETVKRSIPGRCH